MGETQERTQGRIVTGGGRSVKNANAPDCGATRSLTRMSHSLRCETRPGFSDGLHENILSKENSGRNKVGTGRSKALRMGKEEVGAERVFGKGVAGIRRSQSFPPSASDVPPFGGRGDPGEEEG